MDAPGPASEHSGPEDGPFDHQDCRDAKQDPEDLAGQVLRAREMYERTVEQALRVKPLVAWRTWEQLEPAERVYWINLTEARE